MIGSVAIVEAVTHRRPSSPRAWTSRRGSAIPTTWTASIAFRATACPKAKKEWRRFLGKLAGHEKEHETLTGHEASHLAAEMDGLKFKGTGASEKKAFDAAVKTFSKEFTKNYGGTKIDDRLKEAHKSFDAKTGHGASQGAKLNTTIE